MDWAFKIELSYQALKYKQKLGKKREGKESGKKGRMGKPQDEEENSPCTQPARILLTQCVFTCSVHEATASPMALDSGQTGVWGGRGYGL